MMDEIDFHISTPQDNAAPNVLIVEDNAAIGMLLATIVADAGFSVIGPLTSFRQARAVLGETRIAAALLDVHLGQHAEDDGARLAGLLCDLGVPFIFVTARDRASLEPALQSFAHVTKPIDPDALIRQLHAHLA
jgi:DNA-binding response OmpR family regulator